MGLMFGWLVDLGPVQSRVCRRGADGSRHASHHPQVQGRTARAHGRISGTQTGVGPQRIAAQPPDGLSHQRKPHSFHYVRIYYRPRVAIATVQLQ